MNSSIYYLFPNLYSDRINRLDFSYNSPKFKKINDLLSRSKYSDIITIGNQEKDKIILRKITSGKTPEKIQYFKDEGVPFIGATNVLYYYIDLNNAPKILPEIHNTILKSSQIKKNNVLITMAGVGLGRCAVYESDLECNCNQAVAILDLETEKIIPQYLMYYLNSEVGQLFIEKLQHQADQPNINLEEIKRILVILPSKEEQKAILERCRPLQKMIFENKEHLNEAMESYDRPMCEGLNGNPQKYDKLYKSNFYFTFTDKIESKRKRLDYIANHPLFDWVRVFRDSKQTISLESLINPERFSYGLSVSGCENGPIGFLNIQHLSFEGRILFDPKTFLSESPTEKILLENDILIARTGHTLGKSALITKEFEGYTFGSFCIRFSLTKFALDEYEPDFIAQFINSIYGQAQLMLLKAGSGKNNINQEHIRDIKIPKLDKKQQQIILDNYRISLTNLTYLETNQTELIRQLNDQMNKELFL
jgi:restriction endonuclease S subunit